MARDKNNRYFNTRLGQLLLQVQTAQAGQLHIEHQATRDRSDARPPKTPALMKMFARSILPSE